MSNGPVYGNVVSYLGGDARLRQAGVRAYDTDSAHVCLKLLHPNPHRVSTVTITACACNCYAVDCFGRVSADTFNAPLVAHAQQVAPEHLSAVLGELTGDDKLHHHMFDTRGH